MSSNSLYRARPIVSRVQESVEVVFSASNNITQICHRNVKTTNRLMLSLQSPFSFLSFCLIYCEWNCSITALLKLMSMSDLAVLGMELVNDFSVYKKTEHIHICQYSCKRTGNGAPQHDCR